MAQTTAEIRREKLRARQKQAVQDKGKKGLGRKSVLDWGRFVGEKPSEFVPRAGKDSTNMLDFLPFIVTQTWYKHLRTHSGRTTNLEVGEFDYMLEIPVHSNVGENNDVFLCPNKAFGKRCPRCEEIAEEYQKPEPNDKKIRALAPSWRCYYNVYDYDTEANPDGKIQTWENVSRYNIEAEILDESDEGEQTDTWSDLEMGKTVEIEGKEKTFGKNSYIVAKKVTFHDRDSYDEDIVKETVSFDALLKIPTYDEFARTHLGLDDEVSDVESSDINEEETNVTQPEKTQPRQRRQPKSQEDTVAWKEGDGCPSNLEFGTPNLDSKECKTCKDNPFKACVAIEDERKLKEDKEEEKEAPVRRNRRRQK